VQQRSALAAGVALLPLFLPLAVLAPLAGRATARLRPKLPMAAGLLTGFQRTALSVKPTERTCRSLELGGLASGVNNTARQAGGAIGIAAFGALAGSPTDPAGSTTGIHVTALATAALFVVAAIATAVLIPATQRR
jgi:DHA2 family methylenomycin A resistance protein-like MFS transporter